MQTEPVDFDKAKEWAMWVHLSALVGLLGNGIGFLLAPLAVWLIKREGHEFIDQNGKEAVNFQLTMLIANVMLGLLFFLGTFTAIIPPLLCIVMPVLGILLAISIGMTIILPIIAALKARDGEMYRYPLTLRLV